ncbi:MAG: helix-turn-helix transcriptional regulator, partial [Bdellovibrionales bacterium]|nr:helix-turn-helix transcriptional regulator [Bdellovibrionales bacterium]
MSEVQSTEAKQRILDSAASLFSQKGFASTSVRDIAQLAHVNVSSINYYFDSKENLLFTLLAKALHCLDDQMNAIDFDKVKDFSDLVDKMYLTLKQNHDMTLNIM